jgi:putative tricarboxylic transport membrane protein
MPAGSAGDPRDRDATVTALELREGGQAPSAGRPQDAARGSLRVGGTDILRTDKDILSGLFFMALGTLGLWLGWDYAFGTAARMGPGFVPKLLCWLLVATGALIAAAGLIRRGPGMDPWDLRPLAFVLAGVLVFGALIERSGLVAATIGLVLVGAAGSAETRWVETLILSVALAGASVLIFVRGLGLPLRIMAGF